jgi:chitin disaccharide deacetylase
MPVPEEPSSGPMRTLMLNADDFGQSPGISHGIASLAHAGRLSATSCLSSSAQWPALAPTLRGLPSQVMRGLHFNLTEGAPLSPDLRKFWPHFPSLSQLMVRAHSRRLPKKALAAEFAAQLDAFTEGAGQWPDHVDGHQHVHHLPVVRDVFVHAVLDMKVDVAVRSTARPLGPRSEVKRALIARTGGITLERLLQRHSIRHNRWLMGVYDFEVPDYRGLMQGWLANLQFEGGLLFCHPGAADPQPDGIAPARARELAYLSSAAFEDDMAAAHVTLGSVFR